MADINNSWVEKDIKILALDSSGLVASVAVVEGDTLLGEFTVNYKKTHSQTLLPMLDEVAQMIDLDLSTLDAIAVAAGPGSFTGLRIGSATAKGLGQALDKPLIAVPTVDSLAFQLWGCEHIICPIMDARRGQVYTGIYTFDEGNLEVLESQMAIALEDLIDKLMLLGKKVIFLGDGVPVYAAALREKLTIPYKLAPPHVNRQRAASVAALGQVYYRQGKVVSSADHQPVYLRMSQAERERLNQK